MTRLPLRPKDLRSALEDRYPVLHNPLPSYRNNFDSRHHSSLLPCSHRRRRRRRYLRHCRRRPCHRHHHRHHHVHLFEDEFPGFGDLGYVCKILFHRRIHFL